LTAWSAAGVIRPLIVSGILDHYVANNMPKEDAYPLILHIMCGLLVVGFLANLMVRPVAERFSLKDKNIVVPAGAPRTNPIRSKPAFPHFRKQE
jgi:hypothetical protein